jgi:hypothetical protein
VTEEERSLLPADDIKLVAVQYSEKVRNEAYPFFFWGGGGGDKEGGGGCGIVIK